MEGTNLASPPTLPSVLFPLYPFPVAYRISVTLSSPAGFAQSSAWRRL